MKKQKTVKKYIIFLNQTLTLVHLVKRFNTIGNKDTMTNTDKNKASTPML